MADLSNKMERAKQKMLIKAYTVFCVVIVLSMGFYTFNKWQEYSLAKTAVSKNMNFIEVLRETTAEEKANFEVEKDVFDTLNKEIENKLADIFPETDQYTALVRQIDSFEEQLNSVKDPFEVSNLDFQDPIVEEEYSVLPVRMSIRSSRQNFEEFLHLVEISGSLGNQVRLMDIFSITLNFQESEERGFRNEIITFNVQVNAYFQKI